MQRKEVKPYPIYRLIPPYGSLPARRRLLKLGAADWSEAENRCGVGIFFLGGSAACSAIVCFLSWYPTYASIHLRQITELPAAVDTWTELRVLSVCDNALAVLPPQVHGFF